MGHIKYDRETFEFSDLVLNHLQMAVSTKLRRGEHFFITWPVPAYMGSGRHSIWIDNAVPLQFVYDRKVSTKLDMEWMTRILEAASTPGGLHVPDDEPFAGAEAPTST